eukprot:scaffold102_cov340-Pavlova_lutheri.AAC.50
MDPIEPSRLNRGASHGRTERKGVNPGVNPKVRDERGGSDGERAQRHRLGMAASARGRGAGGRRGDGMHPRKKRTRQTRGGRGEAGCGRQEEARCAPEEDRRVEQDGGGRREGHGPRSAAKEAARRRPERETREHDRPARPGGKEGDVGRSATAGSTEGDGEDGQLGDRRDLAIARHDHAGPGREHRKHVSRRVRNQARSFDHQRRAELAPAPPGGPRRGPGLHPPERQNAAEAHCLHHEEIGRLQDHVLPDPAHRGSGVPADLRGQDHVRPRGLPFPLRNNADWCPAPGLPHPRVRTAALWYTPKARFRHVSSPCGGTQMPWKMRSAEAYSCFEWKRRQFDGVAPTRFAR